jgi:hypothetical protein
MAAQKKTCPFISLPSDYNFSEANYSPESAPTTTPPPLGVLSNFTGTYAGTGFNTIFRPNSDAPTTTIFPNPVTPAPPTTPSENVLELNLTTETLTFSKPLGKVPNRGLQTQNDILLNGVPYVQSISDVTNILTGKADDPNPIPIHFEPGLWMHVPATTNDPVVGTSLARLASIPHGTTINAQGLAPNAPISGAPTFAPVSITPFPIGVPSHLIPFISQTASNTDAPRLPQDLTKFIAAGTITQAILDDPNTVLRNANIGKNITSFFVFHVSTLPKAPELGGGTANIAFLQGSAAGIAPNANAVQADATFWVETVEHTIEVPVYKSGQPAFKIHPGDGGPVFNVLPPYEIITPKKITVTSTQIQYSQVVLLNFANLTWPHASVATLVPTWEHEVPASAWE